MFQSSIFQQFRYQELDQWYTGELDCDQLIMNQLTTTVYNELQSLKAHLKQFDFVRTQTERNFVGTTLV